MDDNNSNSVLENTEVEGNGECRLTTCDNPYDPFDDYYRWFMFDVLNGYNTSDQLALIARTSDSFPEEVNNREIERAINEILSEDFQGIYRKVRKGDKPVVVNWKNEDKEDSKTIKNKTKNT